MGYQKRIGMDLRRDRVLNEYSETYGQVKISENKWGGGIHTPSQIHHS